MSSTLLLDLIRLHEYGDHGWHHGIKLERN